VQINGITRSLFLRQLFILSKALFQSVSPARAQLIQNGLLEPIRLDHVHPCLSSALSCRHSDASGARDQRQIGVRICESQFDDGRTVHFRSERFESVAESDTSTSSATNSRLSSSKFEHCSRIRQTIRRSLLVFATDFRSLVFCSARFVTVPESSGLYVCRKSTRVRNLLLKGFLCFNPTDIGDIFDRLFNRRAFVILIKLQLVTLFLTETFCGFLVHKEIAVF
jgi:hypothetical protein